MDFKEPNSKKKIQRFIRLINYDRIRRKYNNKTTDIM